MFFSALRFTTLLLLVAAVVAQGSNSSRPSFGSFEACVHPPNSELLKRNGRDTGPIRLIEPTGAIVPSLNVYLLWYGNWANAAQRDIAEDFVRNLGGSPWWNVLSTYYQNGAGGKQYIGRDVIFKGSRVIPGDENRYPEPLGFQNLFSIVSDALPQMFPNGPDPSAAVMLLTSKDVRVNGFNLNQAQPPGIGGACGFHSFFSWGVDAPWGWVGNPEGNQHMNCMPSLPGATTSPNNDIGVDAMISVLAHELSEISTDPLLNAWQSPRGRAGELADMCAWTYGDDVRYVAESHGKYGYNMVLGDRKFLVQQLWVNSPDSSPDQAPAGCVLSWPRGTPTIPDAAPSVAALPGNATSAGSRGSGSLLAATASMLAVLMMALLL